MKTRISHVSPSFWCASSAESISPVKINSMALDFPMARIKRCLNKAKKTKTWQKSTSHYTSKNLKSKKLRHFLEKKTASWWQTGHPYVPPTPGMVPSLGSFSGSTPSWWLNHPSEKYESNWIISPGRGNESKKWNHSYVHLNQKITGSLNCQG